MPRGKFTRWGQRWAGGSCSSSGSTQPLSEGLGHRHDSGQTTGAGERTLAAQEDLDSPEPAGVNMSSLADTFVGLERFVFDHRTSNRCYRLRNDSVPQADTRSGRRWSPGAEQRGASESV
ncbi:hypothetical protein FQA47_016236 [Oryzias melastigma]|uniref:Uncharacterized protein n=1 Tax=Oryzias melastigma TaxID=30732 RepID=A0A834CC92_ORYME|nr:hypothetical protein FQA47_016236 [Oryzias melastigma]